MSDANDLAEFNRLLKEDPEFRAKMERKAELDEFKEFANADRATPLTCPVCSQGGYSGGSLWINKDDPKKFTCRKCKMQFEIIFMGKEGQIDTLQFVEMLRSFNKGKTD